MNLNEPSYDGISDRDPLLIIYSNCLILAPFLQHYLDTPEGQLPWQQGMAPVALTSAMPVCF